MIHWCGSCKEECDAHVEDEGIGRYEFWGQKGYDTRLVYISDCCDDIVYDDPECMIESELPNKDDWGDW